MHGVFVQKYKYKYKVADLKVKHQQFKQKAALFSIVVQKLFLLGPPSWVEDFVFFSQ